MWPATFRSIYFCCSPSISFGPGNLEINPEYSLEGLILKLKLQYSGHLMQRDDSLEKILMLGKIEGRRRRGQQRIEMVGWCYQLNGHEFEQALGDSEGQGCLVCCSPRGRKELDTTEKLNNRQLTGTAMRCGFIYSSTVENTFLSLFVHEKLKQWFQFVS